MKHFQMLLMILTMSFCPQLAFAGGMHDGTDGAVLSIGGKPRLVDFYRKPQNILHLKPNQLPTRFSENEQMTNTLRTVRDALGLYGTMKFTDRNGWRLTVDLQTLFDYSWSSRLFYLVDRLPDLAQCASTYSVRSEENEPYDMACTIAKNTYLLADPRKGFPALDVSQTYALIFHEELRSQYPDLPTPLVEQMTQVFAIVMQLKTGQDLGEKPVLTDEQLEILSDYLHSMDQSYPNPDVRIANGGGLIVSSRTEITDRCDAASAKAYAETGCIHPASYIGMGSRVGRSLVYAGAVIQNSDLRDAVGVQVEANVLITNSVISHLSDHDVQAQLSRIGEGTQIRDSVIEANSFDVQSSTIVNSTLKFSRMNFQRGVKLQGVQLGELGPRSWTTHSFSVGANSSLKDTTDEIWGGVEIGHDVIIADVSFRTGFANVSSLLASIYGSQVGDKTYFVPTLKIESGTKLTAERARTVTLLGAPEINFWNKPQSHTVTLAGDLNLTGQAECASTRTQVSERQTERGYVIRGSPTISSREAFPSCTEAIPMTEKDICDEYKICMEFLPSGGVIRHHPHAYPADHFLR